MKALQLLALALLLPLLAPAQQPAASSDLKLTVEVLSDSGGTVIDPYMRTLISQVKQHWLPLIAASGQSLPLPQPEESAITLTLGRNGEVRALHLDTSTHDVILDRAAWGAITGTAFAPLPEGTPESTFKLRLHFIVQ